MEQGGGAARQGQSHCLEKEELTSAPGAGPPTPPRLPEPWLARVGFVHLIWGLRSHTAMWPGGQGMNHSYAVCVEGISAVILCAQSLAKESTIRISI